MRGIFSLHLLLRTTVCQRTWTLHQHQLHQGQAQPGWLEQRRLSNHILHTGIPSCGLGHLDHCPAHIADQELHPVRLAGSDLVRTADEGHQQRRLSRKEDHICYSQCWWKWVWIKQIVTELLRYRGSLDQHLKQLRGNLATLKRVIQLTVKLKIYPHVPI